MTAKHLWDDYDPAQKDFLVRTFNDVRGLVVPLDLQWGRKQDHRISDIKDFEFILGNYSDAAELRKGFLTQKEACFEACVILRERTGLPKIDL
ncbi:MAG: hypothetical protein JWO78_279 [Micavibrio sp.]|nr:hypothetical protein [Micavibrio sp.]